jgi:hypothetical protein
MQSDAGTQAPGGEPQMWRRAEAWRRVVDRGGLLRCVWTSHPHHDRHCQARIPTEVVLAAWRVEIEEFDAPAGFFYFSWNGGVWLAYGFRDGSVRGVYCPTHCAERTVHLLRPGAISEPPQPPQTSCVPPPPCLSPLPSFG